MLRLIDQFADILLVLFAVTYSFSSQSFCGGGGRNVSYQDVFEAGLIPASRYKQLDAPFARLQRNAHNPFFISAIPAPNDHCHNVVSTPLRL